MRSKFIVLLTWLASVSAHADLVILQYHHVSTDTPPETSIAPADFERHLQLLQQQHMTVVSLPQAIKALQQGQPLPPRAVAITFDDAYESIYSQAFPLLKQRGWPFTIFVNPGPVDQQLPGTISWDQLRQMQQAGATIANHTLNHPYLLNRPAGQSLDQWLTTEVLGAEQRIKEELGSSTRMLAYPYGEFSLEISDWLRRHRFIAFGQQSGAVGEQTYWQAIPRFPAAASYANLETLTPKLKTLAFNTHQQPPLEPQLGGQNPPLLQLAIDSEDIKPGSLQCFASHEGKMEVTSQATTGELTFTTRAKTPITAGRGRYNCTASSLSKPDYYYWYSQLWINTSVENR
ncbi:polysaccharide deacetylase family protein [Oceanobacter mangrovi]|uniref:polysaccharide deacetylase family protein n=1 Tax=Oceanobacter mangrovi TaxID=2862510 RepID=UPI001C8E0259|nr:polysaccharide deacetylase family protein [Oceanobacter mangrovi]